MMMFASVRNLGFVILIVLCTTALHAQPPLPTDTLLYQLSRNPNADTARVLILNQLAFNTYYSNPLVALRYALEARKVADSLNFTRGEADAFRQMGLAFWAQANIPIAINYYLSGLKIAELHHHRQVEADILSNIGTAYNGLGNTDEAIEFLNRSLALQRELKNRWRQAAVMNNLGDSYLALKEFAKAIESYAFALNMSRENRYPLGESTNTRNIGNVLEQQGLYDSALAQYSKSAVLSKRINDNRGVILSNKSMASVYLKKGKPSMAYPYAAEALSTSQRVNLRAFVRDSYEVLSKIEEAKGNNVEAFRLFKLFTAYKDSVQSLQIVTDVAGQRMRFETEKRETEIELLKRDAQLRESELKNKNYLLLLVVTIGAFVVVLLLVVFRNLGKMREKNEEIMNKHKEVADLNDELVTLNEELRMQQEEVMAQRDSLEHKNKEVERMNQRVLEVNENLEAIVKERTEALEGQNKVLMEYAFLNAHKLRAPLARILGIVNLMAHTREASEHGVLMKHLQASSEQLDQVVRSIGATIDQGLDIFDTENDKTK